MKERRADFHAHITNFENTVSLIEKARNETVSPIALIGRGNLPNETDKIAEIAKQLEMEILFGIEDVFCIDGERNDFVILGVDPEDPNIKSIYSCEAMKQSSLRVLEKQIKFLESEGFEAGSYNVETADLLENLKMGRVYEKAISLCSMVVGNPNNLDLANVLWNLNGETFVSLYSKSSYDLSKPTAKFLWWLYFSIGKPACFNQEKDPVIIANAVKNAGGLFLFSPEGDNPNHEVLKVLTGREYIDGVMGWHGGKLELNKETVRWLRKNKKVILGGSDYNPLRDGELNQWQPGVGRGEMYISPLRLKRELCFAFGA